MPTSSDPCNDSRIQPDAIISLNKSRPVRKPDAKKFSFTFAQLGDPYPFKDVRTDNHSPSSMDFESSHLSEESFEGQFQGYRSYSDSDDLDNLVLYNTIGQYSGDPRDVRLFPSCTGDVNRRRQSPVKPEEKGSVGLRINQLEGATRRYTYNPEVQARNKSLEEEAQRPEVRALINKYRPFSYSEGGVKKEQGHAGDGFISTRFKGQGQRCANNNIQESSDPLKSLSPDNDQVGWVLTKKPDISKTEKRLADKHSLSVLGQQTSGKSGSANVSRKNELQAETALSQSNQSHNIQYLVNEQVGRGHSPQRARGNRNDSGSPGLAKSKVHDLDGTKSVSKLTLDSSGLDFYTGSDRRQFWRQQTSPGEWNVGQAWQTRSMDDSCFSGPAPSDSSDRSSRIDPQVYQSYTAGILHSSYRSNRFLKLQNYYSMLERVAAIEGQTLAKNAVSGKSRFNLVNIRSKSLGSLAPQSRADNILLQKYDVDNIWELKELYADLEEAQDEEQFLFDTGRLEDFQWNPWEDWGIQNKKLSTQQLQFMFEKGLNMNTQASLRKLYRGTDIDFKREMSFRKLYEKYKHLDEETRRQRILDEWALRGQRSRKNSESSSTLSYGSNMTGTYLELMEKAAQKARQRALYGYHIPEEYNNYEKHVQRMKKLTRSCPDLNRLLKDKGRRSRDRLSPCTVANTSLKADVRNSPSKVKTRSRSEHRSPSKYQKSNDDFDDIVTKRSSTEIGHLLRQELGETSSTDAGSGIEIRKWRDTTPPWRSKKTTDTRKTARSSDGYRSGNVIGEQNQRSLEKGDSGLNMSWDDSFDSEETLQRAERPSRSRTRARPAWRSEVRGVVGAPIKDLKTEASTEQRLLSKKEESMEQKLENFRKRHGWRKDSKPDPGTVSRALNVFQAMEEEVIVPQHYEHLVGDGNPSLERRRKEAESEAFHAQNYFSRTEDPDLISSHYQFQRSKSVSAKRDPYLQHHNSSTSFAKTQIMGHSGLQSSKSEPDLHGKCGRKSEAFLQAKYRFEEMAAENEASSYPKTGLPSRSPNTALGRYEARIRETSKKGEMSQRPRSVGEMSNRSAEYDKFQAELRKHPRNTDEQSTSSWKDKELYLEEHISTKLQAKSGSLNLSNRRRGVQKSQEWEEPESPPDGRVSRLEMRRDVLDDDLDRDDTEVKQPFSTDPSSRPTRGASNQARKQPADDKGFVLIRYPQNEHATINESSSSMYETDLDTSMSQPVVRSTDGHGAGQLDFDKSGRRVRPQTEVGPSPNAMTCNDAKRHFQSQNGRQHPREVTRMAVISPNAFGQEKPVTDTRLVDRLDNSQSLDESPPAFKSSHRSYSMSVLANDPAVHDPAYGDLSKWSRVTLVDGLERSEGECGRLQKSGPACLNAAATMSSNETVIIKDSDLEMSPHESSESLSGRLPSQCTAEPSDRMPASVGASVSQQDGREWTTITRTVSGDLKQIRRESGDDLALNDRQTGKDRSDDPIRTVGIPFRRRASGDRGKDVNDEPARYKWKREYDVPPNVDIEQLRQSKLKKDAALQHTLGVIRNYTREAGPQDFYNDLERVGEEWKRDTDKKQTRQQAHDGGSRPLPQYRPPPCYVHPWLEQQSNLPQEMSKDSLDSFHPPNYSTPCASQSNVVLNGQQIAGRSLPQSKSCPEFIPKHQREYGTHPNANQAHPPPNPPFLSSQQASHLQLANTHGMHKPMESRHGDMNPTNQSEHVHTTTATDSPRQRHSVSGTGRSPTGSWDSRRRRDEEAARRKQEMKRITAQEKLKRMEEERKANEARRHNDFLTPSQKSPIPLNRYEDVPDISDLQRPKKKVGVQYRGKARALYNFKAQNPKELSFKKNDIIYLLRQIDKNWYEGEHHGLVGLFPVNYVEVLMSLDEARQAAIMREGRARAKYNFTAQSNMEVSFKKGDTVSLIRRIDNNWFEGRVDGKHGIFPVSYVEVLQEPDTPLPTPMSSYAPTPATGSPGQLSPVSTISNGPAPTIPSAPISPRSSVDNFDFGQPFSFSQYQPSTTASLQRGTRRDHSYADYGLDPLNQMRPASALGGITDGYGTMPRDRYNPANRPNSAVPFSDYMKTSTRDSGFYSSEESKYSRQKSREEELMRSLSNPYEGRQSSMSRDSFSRAEEPRYPPYQAMYSYRPQNPDELELREGDIVYVMEKCDDDWYVGTSQRTKEFGTFPGNYVRPL